MSLHKVSNILNLKANLIQVTLTALIKLGVLLRSNFIKHFKSASLAFSLAVTKLKMVRKGKYALHMKYILVFL